MYISYKRSEQIPHMETLNLSTCADSSTSTKQSCMIGSKFTKLPGYKDKSCRLSKILSFIVTELPSFRISEFLNFQVAKFPCCQVSQFSSFQIFKFPSFQVTKLPSSDPPFPGRPAEVRRPSITIA